MSKTAYMVMGRWQPLHKGHITLIQEAYQKAKEDSNDDFVLYIIVAEYQGKKNELNKNPLTKEDRVAMLSKMLSIDDYPNVQIRTTERPSGRWQDSGLTDKEVKRIKTIGSRRGEIWSTAVTKNLLQEGQYKYTHDENKKKKYDKVKIFVGSDRYTAFKKYNESNCVSVEQCGKDRGPMGKQLLFDEDEMEVANILLNIKQKTELIEIPFSGSQTRDYAIDLDFNNFRNSVKVGNVTDDDAMRYMNLVRKGLGFDDTIELKHYDYDKSTDTYKINPFALGQFGKIGGKKRKTMKLKSKRKKNKKSKKIKKRNKSKKCKRKSKKIVKKNKIKQRKRKNIKKTKKK